MKLITYLYNDSESVGVLREDGILSLRECGIMYRTMNELIAKITDHELNYLKRVSAEKKPGLALADVKILAPIPRPAQDVICLGLNYTEHVEEAAGYSETAFGTKKEKAVYFSKRCAYSPGTGEGIPSYPGLTEKIDYEAELAVIIGKKAFRITPEEAAAHVFGYTVLNDLTARDVQTGHVQWYLGKSPDGFCPMGPCILTADETAFPPKLEISCTVNGELRQKSDTSFLIHGIAEVISELSQFICLMPGTIIATGTPKGTAMGFDPPRFLKKGDVVACTIEKIGTLENPVI